MLLSEQEIFLPNLPKKHEPKGLEKHGKRVVSRKNMGKGLSLVKIWEKGCQWKKQGPQGCLKIKRYKGLSLKKREKGCLSKKHGKRVVSRKTWEKGGLS